MKSVVSDNFHYFRRAKIEFESVREISIYGQSRMESWPGKRKFLFSLEIFIQNLFINADTLRPVLENGKFKLLTQCHFFYVAHFPGSH